MKFRSSMTLFAKICPDDPVFTEAIGEYYGGECQESGGILKACRNAGPPEI